MKRTFTLFVFLFTLSFTYAQFANPGFETITCTSSCDDQQSQLSCIPGWDEVSVLPGPVPMVHKISCGEIVCAGNNSIRLLGTSGSGSFGAKTTNPMFGLTSGAQVIQLTVFNPIESNPSTGICISGSNGGGNTTFLGSTGPIAQGSCQTVTVILEASVTTFSELHFGAGNGNNQCGHIDIHIAIMDDVTYCGPLFEITDQCGDVTVTVNDCFTGGMCSFVDVFNSSGNEVASAEISSGEFNFQVTEAGSYSFEFAVCVGDDDCIDCNTPNSCVECFFYTVVYVVETVDPAECCEGEVPCEAVTSLVSCETQGISGFIHLQCHEGSTYEWDFPTGSTAYEVNAGSSSIVLQASEGIYSVTITDAVGCTYVQEFEVVENCCDEKPCDIPEGLDCKTGHGWVTLSWNVVGGAVGYIVEVVPNDGQCCDLVPSSLPWENYTTETQYSFPLSQAGCFSWRVKTDCSQGSYSDFSTKHCFVDGICYAAPHAPENTGVQLQNSTHIQPLVYPNPSNGNFTVQLDAQDELEIVLEVFDTNGKAVRVFEKETIPSGHYFRTLDLKTILQPGIYYLNIKTNHGNFNEKVILMK